jgi:hypothetical protein
MTRPASYAFLCAAAHDGRLTEQLCQQPRVPTIIEMGQRLADAGYVVLAPDLYYRAGGYDPLNPKEVFA